MYKLIARKQGKTVKEVKRDMQKALDEALEDPAYRSEICSLTGCKEKPSLNRLLAALTIAAYRATH